MDKVAEKLAGWFGSTPFIVFHVVFFSAWTGLHVFAKFDPEWSLLTIIVSLEAIFLSLFILRAENIQGERFERKINQDIRDTDRVLKTIQKLKVVSSQSSPKRLPKKKERLGSVRNR